MKRNRNLVSCLFLFIWYPILNVCLSKAKIKGSSREREGCSKIVWKMGLRHFNFLLNPFQWGG